jgi:hypothetical protein
MHLIEQYALSSGLKIDRPSIEASYFPLPFKDYIILHPTSGMKAKNYDYFQDVVELLTPYLFKKNIKIVQIGGAKDRPIPGCYHLQGATSLNQSFYLIKKCKLLIGNDSFSSHVAGGYNRKIVSLYSNLYKECCRPYWGDSAGQVLIQADRGGKKPSFSASEAEKVVNAILPEEIASGALGLLEIKNNLHRVNTLHLGKQYSQKIVEIVPNYPPPANFRGDNGINIRGDYMNNPEIITQWAFRAKSHLVIKEPLDPKFFHPIKSNLIKVSIMLTKDTPPDYIQFLKGLGIQLELFCEDPKELNNLRLKFIRWVVDDLRGPSKKELDLTSEICNNTSYQSSKTILSHGKEYSSKAAWIKGIEKTKNEKIIDDEEFWKESEFFKIYNLDSNGSAKK